MPQRSFKIVSVRYAGQSPDELVELLSLDGVGVVIDVRLNTISCKRGSSRSPLARVPRANSS